MKRFVEIFKKFLDKVIIQPTDSENEKAIKIIWYSIFAGIIILFIISWLIFFIFTFNDDKVKVPLLKGDDVYSALDKLYERNLVSNVKAYFTDDYDIGIVYRQDPGQGSIVKRGRSVTFFVSRGPKKASLPDFSGFSLFDLEDYLKKEFGDSKVPYSFELPSYEFNETIQKGRIIRQSPEQGTSLKKVKKVKLWISNGVKDEKVKILKNYTGKNIEDVSKDLGDLEILYSYKFDFVDSKDQDMIITEQSIGEGKPIDEIIEENKVLIFVINKYRYANDEKIKSTYLLDLKKMAVPVNIEVKIKNENKERSVIKLKSKGGVSIPVPYTAKKETKMMVYYDGKLENEINLFTEDAPEAE